MAEQNRIGGHFVGGATCTGLGAARTKNVYFSTSFLCENQKTCRGTLFLVRITALEKNLYIAIFLCYVFFIITIIIITQN